MILDGLAHFGVTLEQWRTSEMPRGSQARGLAFIAQAKRMAPPPPLDQVSDAAPLAARIYQGWWIVDCPCRGADFVWLATPLVWCGSCGNAQLGGLWRRVVLPDETERRAIEAALLARPLHASRNWIPGETVADLLAENAEHGL